MYNFKKFLFQTEGETMYLFWMDVEHLKCHQSQFYIRKIIIRICHTYIMDGSPFQLSSSFRDELVSVQKANEPHNRWNMNQQIKELVRSQAQVLKCLREYWCVRYALRELGGREEGGDKEKKEKSETGGGGSGKRLSPVRTSISDEKIPRKTSPLSSLDSDEIVGKLSPVRSTCSDGNLKRTPSEKPVRKTVSEEEMASKHSLVKRSKEKVAHQDAPMRSATSEEKIFQRSAAARKSLAEEQHLPAVTSTESADKGKAKKASHIKISSSKIPYLFSGANREKSIVAQSMSNDTLAKSTIHSKPDPNSLLSSSAYDLFSESSSSLLHLDLIEEKYDSLHLEPYICAALRADFTAGNPLQRFFKTTSRNPEAVNYMLFWQSIENILSQDEMRRWYTINCLRAADKADDTPTPYLSYFEPYLVAKNLQELCLFFLQPKALHKVKLPRDMEEKLSLLLPKGLGQGLLLAAQEYAIQVRNLCML